MYRRFTHLEKLLFAVDTQAESTGSAHKFVERELEQLVQDKRCSGVTKHSWARPGLYVKKGDPGPYTVYDYDVDGKQRALELLLSWLQDDRRISYFW
jgi:hypothetical protein